MVRPSVLNGDRLHWSRMKSSPHRPLILKRRKLSLPNNDASSTLAQDEPGEQSNGSSNQEHSRTDEHSTNREDPGTQEIPTGIKIMNHPTMPNTQVVAVPANTDIKTILEALTAKGKESGCNGPNKFILISSGSGSLNMETRAFKNPLRSEDEQSVTSQRAQEEEKDSGQNSGTREESTPWASESQFLEEQEQEGNNSGESCSLGSSLTNIQWLGTMSSSGLNPCNEKKETEKENLTPKQKTIKAEEGSTASSCTTSWHESFSERPPYSYMAMIQFAINSTEKKRMMLKDIYTWIEDHFPYFKHVAKPGWKNSIRHNLSLHDMFVRETSANGKISFWTIHPEANRYLTLDQVFKQQKRHTPDLQKNLGGTSGSKTEPQPARRKMKPLLPRVNSYLVPIQFPMSQSLILQPSSKMPLPVAQGASETVQSSKPVHIAPKVLPPSEEPALFPAAIPIKEETYHSEESSPFAPHQSTKENACQIGRESFPAALHIKEENDSFHASEWVSSSFLPAVPIKEELPQPGEESDLFLPASPAKQKRQFTALKSPSWSMLDMLVIKRRERHETGRSRRKQHLALPCSEEPVLVLSPSSGSNSFTLGQDISFGQETTLGEESHLSCSQGDSGPFKTPIKEMLCKLPISSTPSKIPSNTTQSLSAMDSWRLAPVVKETTNLDFSPARTPPIPLLSLQEKLDLLEFSSSPLRQSLFDSPQPPLLNTETNDMVSGPLTSSPVSSKQSSPELQASLFPENHSLLEGLVLDTMNDSLSKILLDVSFPGLEDDNLGTDLSWSQFIPELK
ncbi:forkhead box protein M1 isoform X2 [Hemicordylus capensis]|uniref:forkhead box protein M1 isoform X2 n=1 Tax=Hemicordylus capensis TaxID=884348 RepID=UPI00230212A8|nr:forkhead box protein M1 isoform X2 [Hemicordylus capensis]